MSRPTTGPSLGCGYAFAGVIALGGILCLCLAVQNHLRSANGNLTPSVWVPAAIGLALLLATRAYLRFARRAVRAHAEEERIRAENPDAPWLWQREWRGPHIAAEGDHAYLALWLFAGGWNALTLPGLIHFIRTPNPPPGLWVILGFLLVGLGIVSLAIYLTLRRRKYGRARFLPATLPGVIGGDFAGIIEVPARVTALGDLVITLRCIHRTIVGSGKHRRVNEAALWSRELRLPPEKQNSSARLTEIPVHFAIPAGRRPTSLTPSHDQIIWRLSAEAETPGVDFKTDFHVPVFSLSTARTDSSATSAAPSPATASEPAAPQLDPAALARAGIERLPDGWRFSAPRPLPAIRLGSTAVFTGLCLTLLVLASRGAPGVAYLIVLFPLLISAAFTYDLWHDGHELRLAGDDLLIADRAWFQTRLRRVPRADVAALETEKSVSFGSTQYHRLMLVGRPLGEADASAPPHPFEPFAARKLRRSLARALPAEAATLRPRLAAQPSFRLRCAGHLAGPELIESLRAELLDRLTR